MIYGIWDGTKVIASFVVPMAVRSNQPVFSSDTLSLKRVAYRRTAQRWEIDTKLSPLHTTAQDLMVNLIVNGHGEIVQAVMPQNVGAKAAKTMITQIITSSAANANDSTVTIGAVNNSNGKVIPKGTFIRFNDGAHTKVYMLKNNVTISSTVPVTLQLYPQLRKAVPEGTIINYQDDVIINLKYDTDTVIGMVYEDGILMDNGAIKLIEAV
jgi:mRNA-degrading endonuclease toxin of MazEF toxin-antitoxin module